MTLRRHTPLNVQVPVERNAKVVDVIDINKSIDQCTRLLPGCTVTCTNNKKRFWMRSGIIYSNKKNLLLPNNSMQYAKSRLIHPLKMSVQLIGCKNSKNILYSHNLSANSYLLAHTRVRRHARTYVCMHTHLCLDNFIKKKHTFIVSALLLN